MASTTLTVAALASSSFCVPSAIRVSPCILGRRAAGSVRFISRTGLSRAAIDELSPPLEQARQEEGISRREAVLSAVLTALCGSLGSTLVLAPRSGANELKQTDLPIEDVKKILEDDFVNRNYLVTGDMTQSIYDDNCKFNDPVAVVIGAKTYSEEVKKLFDGKSSKIELLNIEVSGPRTIDAKFMISGYLNFPWRPYVEPYVATSRFTVGADGLVESYDEQWTISLLEAFAQIVTPSILRPGLSM